MKKRKLLTAICATALIGVIGVGATLAYFTDTDDAKNVITMGHVDIELTEPIFSENPDNTITDVVPNQEITKDPTITVQEGSEDCFLRAKIEVTELNDTQVIELLKTVNIKDGWVLGSDGYYYYQESVAAGKSINLFDKVTIPEAWGNEVAKLTFEINISAEAIQADNFNPDVDADGVINSWTYSDGAPINPETYEVPSV